MGVRGTWAKLLVHVLPAAWQRHRFVSAVMLEPVLRSSSRSSVLLCNCAWSWKRELLALAGLDSVHRNGTLGSPATRAKQYQKNIEPITSFSFHWEETSISCSSYTRKRELKRYATRYLRGRAAETEEQTAEGRLVGYRCPDSHDSQLPCWQKCILQGLAISFTTLYKGWVGHICRL